MNRVKQRHIDRKKRIRRIRKHVLGTPERPRLSVRRSLRHVSAQIIDDISGTSLCQVSSAAKGFEIPQKAKKSDISRKVGELIAGAAKEKGIEKVVFDRRGYPFHGRIKALADGARSAGLEF